jgi:anti-anti-sigma factor
VDAVAISPPTPPIISIVARPYPPSARIRLVGEIDMAAEPALARAIDRLSAVTLSLIVIDLTAVTFVCSTLINFLCALHRAHPGAELVLHHPSPLAAVIVPLAGMDRTVVMTGVPA